MKESRSKKIPNRICIFIAVLLAGILALAGCGGAAGEGEGAGEDANANGTVTITDMAGRTAEIPAVIGSVYSSSPVGTNLIYTFDDTLAAGTNFELSEAEKKYMTDYFQSLPNLGGWYGKGNQGNIEEIIKAAPDIVLSAGTDQAAVDEADRLQEQLGIPVILVESNDMNAFAETYRFLGRILGDEARGEQLAAYAEETVNHARELTAKLSEDERPRVYYAEEQDGLHTDPAGSEHSRLIELCGGVNVADVELMPGYGRTAVSMEQIIAWDPDVIIACLDNGTADSSSYSSIVSGANWAGVRAVKDGLVFQTPTEPQNWFDRPPSVNTLIGVKWAQTLFCPQLVDYDIREETKRFYALFYHVTLTDEQVASILEKALR